MTDEPTSGVEVRVRAFQEWLNDRREADVSSVFHEIVGQYRAALATPAASPASGVEAVREAVQALTAQGKLSCWVNEDEHTTDFLTISAALATPAASPATEAARKDRDPQWNAIYSTLRNYRMSNMRDDIGGGYPLVDLMSNDGSSIETGEEEMAALADEISLAVAALATPAASPDHSGHPQGWIAKMQEDIAATPSPAPAAVDVEGLVKRLGKYGQGRGDKYCLDTSKAMRVMDEAATALSTLAADKARMEADRDAARKQAGIDHDAANRYVNEMIDAKARAEAAEARALAAETALSAREVATDAVPVARATIYSHGGRQQTVLNEIDGRLGNLGLGTHDLYASPTPPAPAPEASDV